MEIRRTTCVLDCPDTCALEVTVDGGRVKRIGGTADATIHPDTAGFICSKVAGFGERLEHPDRLLHPLRRTGRRGGDTFERVSWEEAISEIARRFGEISRKWGPEAILPYHYGGSNGLLSDGLADEVFFSRLGSSRLAKTICAAPTTAVAVGMYGKMPGVAFGDYVHSRFILIWGANPKASNIHLVPFLRQAKKAGALIATIDPRRNFSSQEIDLHLPVLPGTDLPVALAMIAHWERSGRLDHAFLSEHAEGLEGLLERARGWTFESAAETAGVEAADIEKLAVAFAEASPAVVRCGWGVERNRNGGQAAAAILAMPALLGKFGVRGGGYTMSNGGAHLFDKAEALGDGHQHGIAKRRLLNMTRLGRFLTDGELDPPIKSVFVYNANPVATVPEQGKILAGLAREDLFTVVFEQVMTDTARMADIVLPAATFLEAHDLRAGYGSYGAGGTVPVVEAAGEARSNHRVFSELARAMGFQDEVFRWSDAEALGRVAENLDLEGRRVEEKTILAGGFDSLRYPSGNRENGGASDPSSGPIQFVDMLPRTPGGKIRLTPEVLGSEPYAFQANGDAYPLALISPAHSRLVSSTFGESNYDRLEVSLNPDDAVERGITGGDKVRVWNDRGEVVCHARLSGGVRPGVVSIPKGAWRKSSLNGATSTALCPDHLNVVAGGACFNDARVEVARVGRKPEA